MIINLTVLFDGSFWIGIFEETHDDGRYCVYKYLFGSEPKDYQIYEAIKKEFYRFNFSHQIQDDTNGNYVKKINHKRMQKMVKKELSNKGIGTKAQRAISLSRELNKIDSKKRSKINKEELQKLKFEKKQIKKKQKKKGH